MAFRACIGIVVLALAGFPSVLADAQVSAAPSQPSAVDSPTDYDTLMQQAMSANDAGHFAEAWALFLQAHALHPNAGTLRCLGMAELELERYGDSIQHLEAALSSTERPLSGELRTSTETLVSRARTFVARFTLWLVPDPSEVRVLVDDVPVELPADRTLSLPVGEHVLRVQAPGCQETRRTLRVKGGEAERLMIELSRHAPPSAPLSPPRPPPALATSAAPTQPALRTVWSSPWFWAIVDAAVVGSVLTIVVLAQPQSHAQPPVPGDVGARGLVQTLSRR